MTLRFHSGSMVSKVEPLKKYLIVNPFGIGDVLFTTPVIRAIKDSDPGNIIGYWSNERVRDIFKNSPNINKVFDLSRGDLKKIYRKSFFSGTCQFISLVKSIKKEKFDILLDFSLDHRYSLIAKIIGIKKRVGFNYKNRGRFLTDKIDISGYSDKHVVEYYLDLLKPLGIMPKSYNLDLVISQSCKIKSKEILAGCGINDKDLIIGIAAGAGESWGESAYLKHWPAVKFGQLADKIIDEFKAKIIILGDESETSIADAIINSMHNKPVNLAGETTLEELCGVIDNLHILVANDGGPLHIASALGKETVSFFGPVDPKVYGPYPYDEKRHIVLRKTLECSPCYVNFRLLTCKRNRECMETIDIDSALQAVAKLL